MANPYTVKHLVFGQGAPKICVPLVSADVITLQADAQAARTCGADLFEWRADLYANHADPQTLAEGYTTVREALGRDAVLLFTLRSAREGGGCSMGFEAYRNACLAAAAMGADLVDVELFCASQPEVQALICDLHAAGAGVVASNHDFAATPDAQELCIRLCLGRKLGADLPKLAVMPHTVADVLTLLQATDEANRKGAGPLITMSMGALGGITRLGGGVFGSCLTFGSAGKASAPGQFDLQELKTVLNIVQKSLN